MLGEAFMKSLPGICRFSAVLNYFGSGQQNHFSDCRDSKTELVLYC